MNKNCETCASYRLNKKRVLLGDGVCFKVPSKPKITKKTYTCKWWTEKKEVKQ